MIKYLIRTEKLFNRLDEEYKDSKSKGVLTAFTPTALVSFLIIRLSCEFEYNIHEIVVKKWKEETDSARLHNFLQKKVKIRSSKRTQIKNNLKDYLLDITVNNLFSEDKERDYYDKIFGTEKDEIGTNNIRNQIAHLIDFQFDVLPTWEDFFDYIEVCDKVLEKFETNLNFSNFN